jgi:two-component system chemotaxis sensor kinase CheA
VDLSRYLPLFVSEAGEHLAGYARDLVRLEKGVGEGAEVKPVIDSLFRHAHSVKGMSASMELEGVAALAHRAEDLVDVFRKEPKLLDASAVDDLLAAGDALQVMVQAAGGGKKPVADPAMLERLAETARRCRSGAPAPPRTERAAPASPPAVPEQRAVAPAPEPPPAAPEPPPAAPEPLPAARHRRLKVQVDIVPGCPVPAVRAFLVVKKLAGLGAVVQSSPGVDDLKAGRIPGKRLEVLIDTPEPVSALEKTLAQISDLSGIAVRTADAQPLTPPPAPARAPAAPDASLEALRTVRVRTEILDEFLDSVGELILATARVRELGKTVPAQHRPGLLENVDRLHALVKDLHDKVMTVRMTPLSLVTERLPRAARDIARKVNKQVEVQVSGAEIELDRAILEELSDPLLHLLRNAIDHGLEAPHLRLLAGKAATGHVAIQARRERDRVIVEISDDGRGMDPARLRAAAVARGALAEEAAAGLSEREALMLACLPGVSTAEAVTDVSGRGVGLDAVKRTAEAVGGTLEIDSNPGQGTRFTLRLPLTVAVQPVLLVRVGEEVLGLPIGKVHGAAQVSLSSLARAGGAPQLNYDGEMLPVHDLSRLLGFPEGGRDEQAVVVAEAGEGSRVGLAVDKLLGQQEAVLKPLGQPLEKVAGISAVTVLGNGRPVFILDVQRLGVA